MDVVNTQLPDEFIEKIDQETDNRSEFLRQAVREKLNVDANGNPQKRYAHEPTVTLELTGFEARFIANRLWENAEWDHHSDNMEGDIKLMARMIHTQVAETRSKNE